MVHTASSRNQGASPEIVSFGEIVFDRFEGEAHLGGAPLNFSFYLRQLGVSVALVSGVGRDALGERALRSLADAGVDTAWVTSGPLPTGTVDVSLVDGEPHFTVNGGAAWETIRIDKDLTGLRPTLLYFGTIALKTAVNRATLRKLCSLNPRHILADLNLRPGLHSRGLVLPALGMATMVKMNEEEWRIVREMTSQDTVVGLMESFGLEIVALTAGAHAGEAVRLRGGACRRTAGDHGRGRHRRRRRLQRLAGGGCHPGRAGG